MMKTGMKKSGYWSETSFPQKVIHFFHNFLLETRLKTDLIRDFNEMKSTDMKYHLAPQNIINLKGYHYIFIWWYI